MLNKKKKIVLSLMTMLLFFILDRLIKNLYFVNKTFAFLKFQENSNFLFIFQHQIFYWLTILILLILVFFILKSYRQNKKWQIISLILILLGGFSNFWDRSLYGFVIDYFNFFNLWTFNLADLMILAGAIIWLWPLLKIKK